MKVQILLKNTNVAINYLFFITVILLLEEKILISTYSIINFRKNEARKIFYRSKNTHNFENMKTFLELNTILLNYLYYCKVSSEEFAEGLEKNTVYMQLTKHMCRINSVNWR